MSATGLIWGPKEEMLAMRVAEWRDIATGGLASEQAMRSFASLLHTVESNEGKASVAALLLSTRSEALLGVFVAGGGLARLVEWLSAARTADARVAPLLCSLLKVLAHLPLRVQSLKVSGAGRIVKRLSKNSNAAVAREASALMRQWKDLVRGVPSPDKARKAAAAKLAAARATPPPAAVRRPTPPRPTPPAARPAPVATNTPAAAAAGSKRARVENGDEPVGKRRRKRVSFAPRETLVSMREYTPDWSEYSLRKQERLSKAMHTSFQDVARMEKMEEKRAMQEQKDREERERRALQERLSHMKEAIPFEMPKAVDGGPSQVLGANSTVGPKLNAKHQQGLERIYIIKSSIPDSPDEPPAEPEWDDTRTPLIGGGGAAGAAPAAVAPVAAAPAAAAAAAAAPVLTNEQAMLLQSMLNSMTAPQQPVVAQPLQMQQAPPRAMAPPQQQQQHMAPRFGQPGYPQGMPPAQAQHYRGPPPVPNHNFRPAHMPPHGGNPGYPGAPAPGYRGGGAYPNNGNNFNHHPNNRFNGPPPQGYRGGPPPPQQQQHYGGGGGGQRAPQPGPGRGVRPGFEPVKDGKPHCIYFHSKKGCRAGEKCSFWHDRTLTKEELDIVFKSFRDHKGIQN